MEGTYRSSAQANFDCVKKTNNVSNEQLRFTTTEFNYKERIVTEAHAATGLLTSIFDNIGVVNTGGTPVADRTFPWNLFNTHATDLDYGMAVTLLPEYKPTLRGCVLARTWTLLKSQPWQWVSSDPRGTGVFELQAPKQSMTIWTVSDNHQLSCVVTYNLVPCVLPFPVRCLCTQSLTEMCNAVHCVMLATMQCIWYSTEPSGVDDSERGVTAVADVASGRQHCRCLRMGRAAPLSACGWARSTHGGWSGSQRDTRSACPQRCTRQWLVKARVRMLCAAPYSKPQRLLATHISSHIKPR
jgi:hypothetical protein